MKINPSQNLIVYSLPGEEHFQLGHQNDFGVSDRIDGKEDHFVVRPFLDENAVCFIRLDVHHRIDLDTLEILEFPKAPISEQTERLAYLTLLEKTISQARTQNGKIVLSRIDEIGVNDFNLAHNLKSLRTKFPTSLVYFLSSKAYGFWMGATPEILVEQEGTLCTTMALAGTKWGDDLFTQKEFDEQMLVTRDIMERLSDHVIEVGDVHEFSFGELRHLRTMIRWEDNESIFKVAEKLHPTPAVSGFPRKSSLSFILATEPFDRSLYTGYLGLIKANEKSQMFVNLRCMRLFDGQVRMHVGGGVNEKSDAISEWEETLRKRNSVMEVILNG